MGLEEALEHKSQEAQQAEEECARVQHEAESDRARSNTELSLLQDRVQQLEDTVESQSAELRRVHMCALSCAHVACNNFRPSLQQVTRVAIIRASETMMFGAGNPMQR